MTWWRWVPDDEEEGIEEAVPENTLTTDHLDVGSDYSGLLCLVLRHGPFYETGTETSKKQWKKNWYCIETFFREMKKQKSQTEMTMCFCKVHRVCPPLFPPLPHPLPPLRQWDQPLLCLPLLSLLSVKMRRVKTVMTIHFHLMNNNLHAEQLISLSVVCICVFMWKSNSCTARTVRDVFVSSSSSSSPKCSSYRTSCAGRIWRWIASPHIGMMEWSFIWHLKCVSFLTVLLHCFQIILPYSMPLS